MKKNILQLAIIFSAITLFSTGCAPIEQTNEENDLSEATETYTFGLQTSQLDKKEANFRFNTNDEWTVNETPEKIIANGPGYQGRTQEKYDYIFYKYERSSGQSLKEWIAQNPDLFSKDSTDEEVCYQRAQSNTVTIFDCGRFSDDFFFVGKNSDLMLHGTMGQDSPLTVDELLELITFE